MIEQTDNRTIYGINASYSLRKTLGSIRTLTKFGGSYRGDHIDVSLWKSPDRLRKSVQTDNTVNEVNMAFWLEEDLVFSRLFKIQLAIRGDYFTFHSIDHLDYPEFSGNGLPHATGYAQSAILSPKINMVFSPAHNTDIYLNAGTGFHSNDARDVIIAQRIREILHAGENQGDSRAMIEQRLYDRNFNPAQGDIKTLPRAAGAELGTRFSFGDNVMLSLAGWYLYMEEELVYIGDEGSTEISGETRRIGLDTEIRMQLADWIWADIDLNLSDGRYINEPDDANYIPLAPRFTSQGGINFMHPSGFEGALRYRFMDDRPANENNSVVATGHFINNVVLAYRYKGFRIFTLVENIFNLTWNEAQFDTESRLFYEPGSVSELHFTPGNPFNVQVGFSFEF
jgi:outer membrane receptor protein involved in Fe transport